MPEIIPYESFAHELITLKEGDVAHHSMLYPGLYPSDREMHEHVRAGGDFDVSTPFFTVAKTALANGVRIEWFSNLPRPGEFGFTREDVNIRLRILGSIAALGVDVRVSVFNEIAPTIYEKCGEASPVVHDFKMGLRCGNPRKSSWATFRRQETGKLAISHLNTMDYENDAFLGRMQHYPPGPVDPDTALWTLAWREAYKNANQLNPLSS